MKKLAPLTFAIILFAFSANVFAQGVTFESAKANYESKNYEQAVADLKTLSKTDKANANVWNYLGLSYRAAKKEKDSVKAFKKAIKLAPTDNSIRFNYAVLLFETGSSKVLGEIEKVVAADPKNKDAVYLQAMAYLWAGKFDKAKAASDRLIEFEPGSIYGYEIALKVRMLEINKRIIREQSTALKEIDLFKDLIGLFEKGSKICGGCNDQAAFEYQISNQQKLIDRIIREDVDAKIKQVGLPDEEKPGDRAFTIQSKPRAQYTDEGRKKNISGTIRVLVMFGASGNIEYAVLMNSIGGGLDENALDAAYRIKFTPPIKDGKPVTVMRLVEYTFSIY